MKRYVGFKMVVLMVVLCGNAFAAPQKVNFQGKLTDAAGNPITASVSMVFSIYDVVSGGTALWTETQSVTVTNGIYNVQLGQVNPMDTELTETKALWLGVKVGVDAEMSPRVELTPGVYDLIILNTITVKNSSIGIGTTNPEFKLSLENDGGIMAKGTFNNGRTLTTTGAGERFFWYPRKGAFRIGHASSSEWNDANIGNYSIGMGYETLANKNYAMAFGWSTEATGNNAVAMGADTVASGNYATAFGLYSYATGETATAMGYETSASGARSTAMGNFTIASGAVSTAMGWNTEASADYTTVIGKGDPLARLNNDVSNSFMVGFMNNQTDTIPELLVKDSAVGVNTKTPVEKLDVNGGVKVADTTTFNAGTIRYRNGDFEGYTGTAWKSFTATGTSGSGDGFSLDAADGSPVDAVYVDNDGNVGLVNNLTVTNHVGIGTSNPLTELHLNGGSVTEMRLETTVAQWDLEAYGAHFHISEDGSSPRFVIEAGGNVGIGVTNPLYTLHVNGTLYVSGGADLAEPFDMTDIATLELGDVVVIDPLNPLHVTKSSTAYDTAVAGIVSSTTQAGYVAGSRSDGSSNKPIALVGRVLCNVSTENGTIHIGDLLTTSNTPGYAMKATDFEKRQGAILGKALQAFDGDRGKILVLVTLQ
ncbi:hypothetical protein U27_04722 [Candidatus Vecturithrix granuli]|uniref:Trimeric autotransporter adhesin YadA-like head domain-containing protein n=1 Tax=Vecturithrix granuli TaxID=1499967 RepID=A0A081BZK0_VECG1|nr:hypothetical protein U27_04722 [Candidatus Vecturithrix granuli]